MLQRLIQTEIEIERSYNKLYDKEKGDGFFEFYVSLFRVYGMWPLNRKREMYSPKTILFYCTAFNLYVVIAFLFIISCSIFVCLHLKEMDTLADTLSITAVALYGFIRYFYAKWRFILFVDAMHDVNYHFARRSLVFEEPLQNTFKDDTSNDRPKQREEIFESYLKNGKLLSKYYLMAACFGIMSYLVRPVVLHIPMCPAWYPFETPPHILTVVMIVQSLVIVYGASIIVFMDASIIFSFYTLYSQVQILKASIENLSTLFSIGSCVETGIIKRGDTVAWIQVDTYEELNSRYLTTCVTQCCKLHQELMRVTGNLRHFFRPIMALDCVAGLVVLVFCVTELAGVSDFEIGKKFSVLQLTVVGMIHVAGFCWLGDKVVNAELSVRDELINLPWYKLNKSLKKVFSIMLLRVDNPIVFDGGPFYILNLQQIVIVVKVVVSTALVLIKFKQDFKHL